jgi:predicted regulator of Ras-like GTPase activity (Roadblock/LC7/MglB family)
MEKVKHAPVFGAPRALHADLPGPGRPWTAPSAGRPPAPPTPAPRITDPGAVLDELVDEVDGVRSALLASVDGFGIARSSSMTDEPAQPAMLAAAVGLAQQLATMGGGSKLRQLAVEHDAGLLVVWPVGTQRVVAVLAASTVEQRRLRAFVQSRISVLAGTGS